MTLAVKGLMTMMMTNTFRPGYLYISNRAACCVAGSLVNK